MRGPSLQKTAFFSAALHLAFFLVTVFTVRHTQQIIMPSPYVVTLVGPQSLSQRNGPAGAVTQAKAVTSADEPVTETHKPLLNTKTDAKHLEDRMSELASKKNIERIVRVRKMIAVGGQTGSLPKKSLQQAGVGSRTGQAGGGSYEDLLKSLISREIVFPDTGESQLETRILVRIMKNGEIRILNIEKRSGNALFDRAALRAIEKANPVPPPPAEMEIEFGLHPYGIQK